MMNPETLAVTLGLGSAVAWGAGDFSGGLATRKGGVRSVIFFSQVIGCLLLLGLKSFFPEQSPSGRYLLWGGLAGLFGTLGLMALYKGLALGRMGIVAPVSAVVTAVLPICFAALTLGFPKGTQMVGFGVAVVAVWMFSAAGGKSRMIQKELMLAVAAGVGFSLFFICIDNISEEAVFWPLVAARLTSITVLGLMLVFKGTLFLPGRDQLPFIALAGILDIAGNTLFALASQVGRLDVSATLSSMYPVSTVLLARCFLREQLHRRQQIGLLVACLALVLIAL